MLMSFKKTKKPFKQRIIILEGVDMSGKTEISHELSKRLDIPRFKASNEHDVFLNRSENHFIKHLQYADPRVVDLLSQTKQSLIMDRAYPSEWVYSKVLGRETDDRMLEKIDQSFANLGAWIIICHRSSYASIVDDLDSSIDASVLDRLDNEYRRFLKFTKCKTMLLNVDDENLQREINDIMFVIGDE